MQIDKRQIFFRCVQIQTNLLSVQNDKFKERFQFQTSFISRRLARLKATRFLTRLLSPRDQDKFFQIYSRFLFLSYQDYCLNVLVKLLFHCLFYFSKFYLSYPSGLQKVRLNLRSNLRFNLRFKFQTLVSFRKYQSKSLVNTFLPFQ